jgi:hypothetical protein
MQRKQRDNVETKTLSIEEQLELFAEIIVDIYFETQFKIEKNEEQRIGASVDAFASKGADQA